MSNYSDKANMCRVDFFKGSGKWHTTEAVEFLDSSYSLHPSTAFKAALDNHFKDSPHRLSGMTAVCLDPYVENAFPLSTIVGQV